MQFNYNNTLTAFSCVLYIFFYWLKDFKAKKYAIFNYKCLSHLTLLFAAISLSLYYSNKSAHSVTAFILEFILNFSVFLLYFGNSSFATHMFVCLSHIPHYDHCHDLTLCKVEGYHGIFQKLRIQ